MHSQFQRLILILLCLLSATKTGSHLSSWKYSAWILGHHPPGLLSGLCWVLVTSMRTQFCFLLAPSCTHFLIISCHFVTLSVIKTQPPPAWTPDWYTQQPIWYSTQRQAPKATQPTRVLLITSTLSCLFQIPNWVKTMEPFLMFSCSPAPQWILQHKLEVLSSEHTESTTRGPGLYSSYYRMVGSNRCVLTETGGGGHSQRDVGQLPGK